MGDLFIGDLSVDGALSFELSSHAAMLRPRLLIRDRRWALNVADINTVVYMYPITLSRS